MRRMRLCRALALVICLPVATTGAGPISAPPAPATAPGAEAPDHVVAEIQQSLDDAVRRFDAMDSAGGRTGAGACSAINNEVAGLPELASHAIKAKGMSSSDLPTIDRRALMNSLAL